MQPHDTPDRLRRRHIRRLVAGALTPLAIFATLPMSSAEAATNVEAGATYSYTEQDPPLEIGGGISITDGTNYSGEYIEFEVDGATEHDILSLMAAATANTQAGVVSIVGNSVYLGNGTSADPIGSIDPVFNGQNGQKLRVNFTVEFENPGFETGDELGWTAIENRVDLGVTQIAGFTTQDTSEYPGNAPNQDNNAPQRAQYAVDVTTDGDPTGVYALQLQSFSMTTAFGCDVVHGPAVYSSEFEAAVGDKIYFDWRAFSGSDAYSVFGYIIDRDGNQTEVLDTYTTNTSGSTDWATKETVIPSDGHYRFVFVAGTYDGTCGQAAGASLLIDNVRVFGTKATDAVAQQIARMLQYENTSDAPPASRTVNITAKSNTMGEDTDSVTVDITPVDDPPVVGAVSPVSFTNTMLEDSFSTQTGTIPASDPDGDTISFALSDSIADPVTIDGVSYDVSVDLDFATVRLSTSTGQYAVVPDTAEINDRWVDTSEEVTFQVTASGVTEETTLAVSLDADKSLAGAPTLTSATPDDGSVTLAWDVPDWTGESAIVGYRVQTSSDGGSSWDTAIADTGNQTTALVSTLTNGTEYLFRVAAINAAGVGPWSEPNTATPYTTPSVPSISDVKLYDGALEVFWHEPASDGGSPITGWQVSVDDGATWSDAYPVSDSSATVTGLTNGAEYRVRVRMINAAGEGEVSPYWLASPRTIPGAPEHLAVAEDDGLLVITFDAPSDDGGRAITGYEYTLDGGTTWQSHAGTTITVSGLGNGVDYAVRVRAVNEVGAGPATSQVVATPRTVPGAPGSVTVTEDTGSVHVTVTAPADDGGADVEGYQYSLDGGATWSSTVAGPTFTIDGLANGTTYEIVVRAVNEAGPGTGADAVTATPRARPAAPAGVTVVEDDSALHVTFDAPADDGGAAVEGYQISTDGGMTWSAVYGAATTSVTIDGLDNGTTYDIRVRAINEAGAGTASAKLAATPRTIPGAPGGVTVVEDDSALHINFTAPVDDGGADVEGYQYSLDGGATWSGTVAGPTFSIDGLANGTTYDVRVRAVNEAGAGAATASVLATPRTVPGAPAITKITPGDRSLTVEFAAPTDDGGAAVTGYQISLDDGRTWSASYPAGSTSVRVFGLDNGTSYGVRIRAINEAGAGATSTSVPATPELAPVADHQGNYSVPPGNARVIVDGEEVEVTITAEPGTAGWTMSGDGWRVTLNGLNGDGTAMAVNAEGRLVVIAGGMVRVNGDGFKPGSIVDVWMFSIPQMVGQVRVGADGTFDELLDLPPGLEAGDHTVELNGLGADGTTRSAAAGLVVLPEGADVPEQPAGGALPRTGSDSLGAVQLAAVLLVAGAALLLVTRRRRDSEA
jgi:LPXTG-motif cell wall-anchored protein